MKEENIKIKGYVGTWHVIDETEFKGEKVYLLEHEQFGDAAASLIVNEDLDVILDDAWDGFLDLEYLESGAEEYV